MNIPPSFRRALPGVLTLLWAPAAFPQAGGSFPLAQSLITVESTPPPLGAASPAPAPAPSPVLVPPPTVLAPPAQTLKPSAPPPAGSILLNFQGAALSDVLAYLSEAAGFVIVQEAPVQGTVNIVSKQPISVDESVDLLNSVLAAKGYVAIRNGRILKIAARSGSQKLDLPVETGADPAKIPRNDEVVTQILPVHYGEAAKLVENLRPLLADTATISANDGSNAILLTDTQANIRRMAMIVHALDNSVSSISTIRVFPLSYADAKALADTVTSLFATPENTQNQQQNQQGGRGRFFGGGGRGFGGPPQPDPAATKSGALEAAARVVAVADEASNSLIVSASEDVINEVEELVKKVDRSTTDITDTRIFRLVNADAVETADIINNLYGDGSTTSSTSSTQNRGGTGNRTGGGGNNNNRGGGGFPGVPPQFAALLSGNTNNRSERALLQARVVAVGDPRTNSLLVSASHDSITSIAEMVGRLDATDARKQHVYVYQLQHADPDSVANVLRGMTGDTTATTNAASATSRLTDRAANGASTEATQAATSTSLGGGR